MKQMFIRYVSLVVMMIAGAGCAGLGDAIVLEGTDPLVKGQILPIKDNPKSLGRKRLEAYADIIPTLKQHFEAHGYPDRIIETNSLIADRKVVMYYTKPSVAYLLVAKQFAMSKAKLVGPSPIGKKTKELFAAIDNLQRVSGEMTNTH